MIVPVHFIANQKFNCPLGYVQQCASTKGEKAFEVGKSKNHTTNFEGSVNLQIQHANPVLSRRWGKRAEGSEHSRPITMKFKEDELLVEKLQLKSTKEHDEYEL